MSVRVLAMVRPKKLGIMFVSSVVKTLQNNLLRRSTLPVSCVVSSPFHPPSSSTFPSKSIWTDSSGLSILFIVIY